jgi:GNAT superfamily N-acetyltransferase
MMGPDTETPLVEIRECRLEDFDGVFPLLRQLWPESNIDPEKMRDIYLRLLEAATSHVFCALSGGRITGFCDFYVRDSLWQQGKLAYVDELVVDESMRGRGTGAALLEYAAGTARDLGCSRIELDSAFHRTDAHGFYDNQGWQRRAFLFGKDLT